MPDPLPVFRRWFRDAVRAGTPLPEAMALATATRRGAPAVRMVLHRGFSRGAFVFYTNYRSRKAQELLDNPRAAIVFHWPLVDRQVRAEGRIEKLPADESDRYFRSRPRESQIGAWISPQSEKIPDRAFLTNAYLEAVRRHVGARVSRPPFWGGFRLVPDRIEFWQARPHRLHDRLEYRKTGGRWRTVRLAP